jgi:type VI protein secretion system component VasK
LLEAPIDYAGAKVNRVGADQVGKAGVTFCSRARPVARSVFFSADGSSQFTVQDLSAVLKPGSGALPMFFAEALQPALQKQGNSYVPTGAVPLNTGFVAFFNRGMQLSDALFAEDQSKPQITFSVEPQLPEGGTMATIVLDGVAVRSGQNLASRRFMWPSATGWNGLRKSSTKRVCDSPSSRAFPSTKTSSLAGRRAIG